MKVSYLLLSGVLCICHYAYSQTTPEEMGADPNKTGGVYFAYPSTTADNTPAPKGYKPFHISHYGRHGSRYLISDNDYTSVIGLLESARKHDALTQTGSELLESLDTLMIEVQGRGGDLSPLGKRQHRGIAGRMASNYPEIFKNSPVITARSTLVPRCILSMASFCERLKENNPSLVIDMESSNRYMPYLCHSNANSDEFNSHRGWWEEAYRKFKASHTHPDRLVESIFSDPSFLERYVNPEKFMWDLYWIASDAQNTEGKIDYYHLFTPSELFDLWQCNNAGFYAKHSNFEPANGMHINNARNLLNNIIETADAAVKSESPSVALRFGHDGNVVPLTALMHLEGCDSVMSRPEDFYKGWCDWKVSPMAANVQLVFYRNPKQAGKILVKILHNEHETSIPVSTDQWPYYDWEKVKEFYSEKK